MKAGTPTTLGLRCLSDIFFDSLIQRVRSEATRAGTALGGDVLAGKSAVALNEFADRIEQLDADDPRVYSLYMLSQRAGHGEAYDPPPGSKQAQFLGQLGAYTWATPSADFSVNELVAAAVVDASEYLASESAGVVAQLNEAEARAEVLQGKADDSDRLATELREARETIDGLTGELQEERGNVSYLRERLGSGGNITADNSEPEPKSKPTRIKLDDEPYIYYREGKDGRVYIVGYPNPENRRKTKWKTIGPDLDEARAARDELVPGGVPA